MRGLNQAIKLSGLGAGAPGLPAVRQAPDTPAPISPNFADVERLFFATPFTGWSHLLAGVTQPYRQHVWVYACVNAIAQNIAGVSLNFYTGSKKDKRLVETGPLVDLFESPNPMMNGYQMIEAMLIYLGLSGETICILDRDNIAQVPKEIWPLPPSRFQHVPGEGGLIRGWIYRNGAKQIPLLPHEVLFLRYFNPYDDYRGLSPITVASLDIEQDYYAAKYNRNFFLNGAQLGGFLETDENLVQEEFDRVLAQFNDRHQGVDKAHMIGLLEGGLKYKEASLSQRDMDFLAGRKLNREQIINGIYKVQKGELGLEDDTGAYAKDKSRRKMFWETCLEPKMVLFEYGFWSQLCRGLTGPEVWPEFDRKSIPALQEDRGLLLEQGQKLWGMGYPANVVNEYLDLGLPKIEGGDIGYLPFNLQPVGSAPPEPTAAAPKPEKASPITIPAAQASIFRQLPGPDTRAAKNYWQQWNKLRTAMEEKFHSKIKRYFYEQRKEQLKLIADKLGGKAIHKDLTEDLLFPLEPANEKLQKMAWGLYLNIGQAAGEDLYAGLNFDPADFVMADSAAIQVLKDKLLQKVKDINTNTREKLRKTLSEGLSNVESVNQLQDRVREVFNSFESPAQGSFARSLTIARTETGQAMAAARDAAMDQLKVEKIEWGTAGDGEVRETHQFNASLGPINRGELFPNGCAYPCDPAGDAGEIINCFTDYQVPIFTTSGWEPIGKIQPGDLVLTHKNRFKKVSRLSPQTAYSGEVVRLIPEGDWKKSKRGVTVTANHRFLMTNGSWKQAQDIQPGEKIQVMAAFCGHCGQAIPYWLKYCDQSCLSKAITEKQWADPEHRQNMSEKARAQMHREYAAGSRDPQEITIKARGVCLDKYGPGGFFSVADRSIDSDFQQAQIRSIEEKYGSRLEMLKKTAFRSLGKASWAGSKFDHSIISALEAEGKVVLRQHRIGRRRVDIYCPEEKLFIECDSPSFHGSGHVMGLNKDERQRDLEILSKYPDHRITHIIFENNEAPRLETFDLLTLNHAGTFAQVSIMISRVIAWKLNTPKRTYNFAVEEDESYIAKGFISHNCRCVAIPVLED